MQSEMVEPALTRRLKGENVRDVYAWTVNDEASVRRVANRGVRGIVTDEPEEATRVIRAMRAMCDAPRKSFGGAGPRRARTERAEAAGGDRRSAGRGRDEG